MKGRKEGTECGLLTCNYVFLSLLSPSLFALEQPFLQRDWRCWYCVVGGSVEAEHDRYNDKVSQAVSCASMRVCVCVCDGGKEGRNGFWVADMQFSLSLSLSLSLVPFSFCFGTACGATGLAMLV